MKPPADDNLFLLFLEVLYGTKSRFYEQTRKLFKRVRQKFKDPDIVNLLNSWDNVIKAYNRYVTIRGTSDDLVSIAGYIEIHSLLEILYERLIPIIEQRNITNLNELLGVY